jgi:hypothetical protein
VADTIELTGRSVTELVGNFYEAHAGKDRDKMNDTLVELDALLMTGEAPHLEFIEYFNQIFSGRTAFNTLLNINDYPPESVIRELLQNAFDCDYDQEDIKIAVNFKDNHTISISYNELGFTLEQFMFYLSFGRNTKNASTSEGRFGVGAKSVFMNVEWLSMRSNNFSFCIMNNQGMLKITDINLRRPVFKGTEIVIKVNAEQHRRIKENFMELTARKGDYINIVELCFAYNKKKILNNRAGNPEVNEKRAFNIAVMHNGKLIDFYKVFNHFNKAVEVNVVRFTQGGKSVVDFICREDEGFVYLIPFALAMSKRTELVKTLTDMYNYFSTYELTGLLRSDGEENIQRSEFASQKLSAFFISVPNSHITSFRTGIRPDMEHEVMTRVEESVKQIIADYRRFFVLELTPNPDESGLYHLRPESYAFEFIKNFILTANLNEELKNDFLHGVSLRYMRGEEALQYSDLQRIAYFTTAKNITKEHHLDGSAFDRLIDAKLSNMNDKLADIGDRILYAGYEWEGELAGEGGSVYFYEFHKEGDVMYVSSENNPAGTDYELHHGFMSLTPKLIENALAEGGSKKLKSETQLENVFAMFDNMFGGDYRIALKDSAFKLILEDEECPVDAGKLKIASIADYMGTVQKRRKLFRTYQDYTDTVSFGLNLFADGKPLIELLRAVKAQDGDIVLQKDAEHDGQFVFMVYETPFTVPADMPSAELLEITGDLSLLLKFGLFNNKAFTYDYAPCRYKFEPRKIAGILANEDTPRERVTELLGGIFMADFKTDRIALLGENDVVTDIIEYKNGFGAEVFAKCKAARKFIVMREDNTKEEFADIIELVITGGVRDLMRKRYLGAKAAKIVIPDQLPYTHKPLPAVTKDEFAYLREIARDITENSRNTRNFYAKDVNSKLYGYGGVCSFCRLETEAINGFAVRDFEVELMHDRIKSEEYFKFSLFLCSGDTVLCDSWVIDDLKVGGMSPFLWLEQVSGAEVIPPELLLCTIIYREQITHDISADEDDSWNSVMSAPRVNSDIVLTPLMAANWVEKNIDLVK